VPSNRPPFKPFPKQQFTNVQETDIANSEAVNFDPDAFDDMLRSHGLTLVHWRALKCPLGAVDADDERSPHGDHGDCSNGFLYRVVAPITCAVSNNSDNPQVLDIGIVNQVNILITPPRSYDVLAIDGSPLQCLMAPYDRLYLAEESITVINWQKFEVCGGPTDKLMYPLVMVEELVDSRGKWYQEGEDFTCEAGLLKWVPGHAPGTPRAEAGTGVICSIRYRYRPYWYVKDLPHEIRVTQLEDPITGVRHTVRMPQQALLQREYVFENQSNDPNAKENQDPNKVITGIAASLGQSNLRQIMAPRSGGFGPR
jgi:hypothetical protein